MSNVFKHGGYGVMVNTRVCGTLDLGSIPSSHPKYYKTRLRGFCSIWGD